jgi:hypothetical protein
LAWGLLQIGEASSAKSILEEYLSKLETEPSIVEAHTLPFDLPFLLARALELTQGDSDRIIELDRRAMAVFEGLRHPA